MTRSCYHGVIGFNNGLTKRRRRDHPGIEHDAAASKQAGSTQVCPNYSLACFPHEFLRVYLLITVPMHRNW